LLIIDTSQKDSGREKSPPESHHFTDLWQRRSGNHIAKRTVAGCISCRDSEIVGRVAAQPSHRARRQSRLIDRGR
jgi:hypothetical protein